MDVKAFQKPNGELVTSKDGKLVFIPRPMARSFEYDEELVYLIAEAHAAVSKLCGMGQLLPNPHILINPYLKREAVLSSKIEGTQASISDLFLYELGEESVDSTFKRIREVRNYVIALEKSLEEIKKTGKKIDLNLIKAAHKLLLNRVRGQDRNPGEFRKVQNWISKPGQKIENAVYVPPAPEHLMNSLKDFEEFIHTPPKEMPILVQCALLHYQFEAIHPFIDGNGRIGRLLMTLLLSDRKILPLPLLYLSAYFERNKTEYYDKLLAVSQKSDLKEWIKFFLNAIAIQSQETMSNIQRLLDLRKDYERKMRKSKTTDNAHRLMHELFANPYTTIKNASQYLDVTFVTAQSVIKRLISLGILKEVTKGKRNRLFVAHEIIKILS